MFKNIFILLVSLSFWSCESNKDTSPKVEEIDKDEALSGGNTTSFDASSKAYTFPFSNLSSDNLIKHNEGDALFEATFVTAPALINPGLGPLFNNTSCKSCHQNDGRAKPPQANEPFNGLLFRISGQGTDIHGGPNPLKGFGLQVQTRAIFGVQPEMDIKISYAEISDKFSDGEIYTLQKPSYTIINPYIPLTTGATISPRIANPNFGLGLLEAIDEKTILALTDENDNNGDGISGKANYVYDVSQKKNVMGRFGWKASQPSILQQSAAAFEGDMGITSPYFPDENTVGQIQDIPTHEPEITVKDLENIKIYIQTLAPPARRNATDKAVLQGKTLFIQAQCGACHVAKIQTGVSTLSEVSNQTIRPYTDLLLHDMGTDLADNRPDYKATGSEWRTAPLWGIGLSKIVNGHTNFLHDGRARNITEAILWHGGEAQKSKENFKQMSKVDRTLLVKFLDSL